MIRREDVYRIGRLGKPHGVKGELMFMFSDDVFDRVDAEYIVLLIDGILVPFFMEEYRFRSSETAIMKLCDIDTQEKARELTNCEVYFPRHLSGSESGEEATLSEIVDFVMIDARSGQSIGQITGVDDSTANILFEVESAAGRHLLVPAAMEWIKEVDAEKKQITVELPEGLLDLD